MSSGRLHDRWVFRTQSERPEEENMKSLSPPRAEDFFPKHERVGVGSVLDLNREVDFRKESSLLGKSEWREGLHGGGGILQRSPSREEQEVQNANDT